MWTAPAARAVPLLLEITATRVSVNVSDVEFPDGSTAGTPGHADVDLTIRATYDSGDVGVDLSGLPFLPGDLANITLEFTGGAGSYPVTGGFMGLVRPTAAGFEARVGVEDDSGYYGFSLIPPDGALSPIDFAAPYARTTVALDRVAGGYFPTDWASGSPPQGPWLFVQAASSVGATYSVEIRAVPEPSTGVLAALGLVCIACVRTAGARVGASAPG